MKMALVMPCARKRNYELAWILNHDERTLRLTLVSVLICTSPTVKKDWRHSETSILMKMKAQVLKDGWKIHSVMPSTSMGDKKKALTGHQAWRHSETVYYR